MIHNLILHLSLIKGIGPVTLVGLIEILENNNVLDKAYELSCVHLQALGVSLKTAQMVVDGLQDISLLENELRLYEKNRISWMSYKNENYPELLKNIYAPPSIITWQGNLEYQQALAIVGSREATVYGKEAVDFFVPSLVENGYTIVSGGAYGIDAWAHEAALRSHGKTIVVVGSGLAHTYPHSHKKLFEKIIENDGALLSIFPFNTSAMPGNFPARNRVIAGLSQGCIVIQAAAKSGAKITADFALQQGRSVFAIPGPFNHPLSQGCNELIKQGAVALTTIEDIAQEFGIIHYRKPIVQEIQESLITETTSQKIKNNKSIEKTLSVHPVVKACQVPQSFDTLLTVFSDFTAGGLQDVLFDLSLEGLIEQDFTGMWRSL